MLLVQVEANDSFIQAAVVADGRVVNPWAGTFINIDENIHGDYPCSTDNQIVDPFYTDIPKQKEP